MRSLPRSGQSGRDLSAGRRQARERLKLRIGSNEHPSTGRTGGSEIDLWRKHRPKQPFSVLMIVAKAKKHDCALNLSAERT
jgi:hypothetical protein